MPRPYGATGMSDRFHRRKHPRITGFDYSRSGMYFVTVCTDRRLCLFGDVSEDAVHLSEIGRVGQACWGEIPGHYPGVATDAFVVMPNHVHGILDFTRGPAGARSVALGTVVGSFKAAVSSRANELRGTPGASLWQRGFHDHVIRGEDDLAARRQYIAENPLKWHLDHEHPLVWRR